MKFNKKYKVNHIVCFMAIVLCFGTMFTAVYATSSKTQNVNINIISQSQVDEIALEFVEKTWTWEWISFFVPYMSKDAINKIIPTSKSAYWAVDSNLKPFSQSQIDESVKASGTKTSLTLEDIDNYAVSIMKLSGNWDYMKPMLKYMTPIGIENIINIYKQKIGNNTSISQTQPTNNSTYENNINTSNNQTGVYSWNSNNSYFNKKIPNSNEADNRGIDIMNFSGTWGETMNEVLPYMTPEGVEKAVAIYFDKHWYTKEGATKAISTVKESFVYMSNESVKKIEAMISNLALPTNN